MCGSRVSLSPAPAPSGSLYSRLWSPPAELCNVLPPETGLGHWAMCRGYNKTEVGAVLLAIGRSDTRLCSCFIHHDNRRHRSCLDYCLCLTLGAVQLSTEHYSGWWQWPQYSGGWLWPQ